MSARWSALRIPAKTAPLGAAVAAFVMRLALALSPARAPQERRSRFRCAFHSGRFDLRGHAQGGVDDGRLGLLPLRQRGRLARRGHNGMESGYGMGHGNQKRTIVLF